MQEAKRRIPHFTLVEEFDVTDLEDTRAMMNRDRGDNPKLTLLPFLIAAMGKALADWPMLNATFDDDAMQLTRHGAMHLGMATQTPGGLMVPVIRDAQGKSVWHLAREIARLADAAKSGKASREELSRLDHHLVEPRPDGRRHLDPGHQPPRSRDHRGQQGARNAGHRRRRARGAQADEPVAVSCDHRVVDGWDAANFLQAMKA